MSKAYDKPWLVDKAANLIHKAKAARKTTDMGKYDHMYAAPSLVVRYKLTSNSSQDNQRRSPFLRLPPELRNQIYELAIGAHVICVYPSWYLKNKQESLPTLLHVCRQTRAETAIRFFSNASFEIESLEKLAAFKKTLDSEHCKAIRTLTLHIYAVEPLLSALLRRKETRTDLRAFPSLEEVVVVSMEGPFEEKDTKRAVRLCSGKAEMEVEFEIMDSL
jgi:hypothetical protein